MLQVSLEKHDGGIRRFWQICVEQNCATVCYGLVGGASDFSGKEFDSMEEAVSYAMEQVLQKTAQGYVREEDQENSAAEKRKAEEDIDDLQLGERLVPAAKKLKSHKTKPQNQAGKQNSQQSDQLTIDLSNSGKELIQIDLTNDPNLVELEINEAGVRRFWQVCVEENCVNTWSGTMWNRGKFYSREFETAEEAEEHADKQIDFKRLHGWKKIRKANNKLKRQPEVKQERHKQQKKKQKKKEVVTYQSRKSMEEQRKKSGQKVLSGGCLAPKTCGPLGHIDPTSKLQGKIYKDPNDNTSYDVMLLKRNLKHDYYYILQLIVCNQSDEQNKYNIFTRWGQVQSMGRGNIIQADNLGAAIDYFADKFEDKTGQDWYERKNYQVQKDMHEWMKGDRKHVLPSSQKIATNSTTKVVNDTNSIVGISQNNNAARLDQNFSRAQSLRKEIVYSSRNVWDANNTYNGRNKINANGDNAQYANNAENGRHASNVNVNNAQYTNNSENGRHVSNENVQINRDGSNGQNAQNVNNLNNGIHNGGNAGKNIGSENMGTSSNIHKTKNGGNQNIERSPNNQDSSSLQNVQNIETVRNANDDNENTNSEQNINRCTNVLSQTKQKIVSTLRNMNEQQQQQIQNTQCKNSQHVDKNQNVSSQHVDRNFSGTQNVKSNDNPSIVQNATSTQNVGKSQDKIVSAQQTRQTEVTSQQQQKTNLTYAQTQKLPLRQFLQSKGALMGNLSATANIRGKNFGHNAQNSARNVCISSGTNQAASANAHNAQNTHNVHNVQSSNSQCEAGNVVSRHKKSDPITLNQTTLNVENSGQEINSDITPQKVGNLSTQVSPNTQNSNAQDMQVLNQQNLIETEQNNNVIQITSASCQRVGDSKSNESGKFKRVTTNLENGFMIQHVQNVQNVPDTQDQSKDIHVQNVQNVPDSQNLNAVRQTDFINIGEDRCDENNGNKISDGKNSISSNDQDEKKY